MSVLRSIRCKCFLHKFLQHVSSTLVPILTLLRHQNVLLRAIQQEPHRPTVTMPLYDSAAELSFIQPTQLIRISLAVWLPRSIHGNWARGPGSLLAQPDRLPGSSKRSPRCGWHGRCPALRRRLLSTARRHRLTSCLAAVAEPTWIRNQNGRLRADYLNQLP